MTKRNALAALLMSMTLTVPMHAWATGDGPGNGGGGGGICMNGKCVGLAEAGFRLPMNDDVGFEVDEATIEQLDRISKTFPYLDISPDTVLGEHGTITSIEIGEAQRAYAFLNKYKKLISDRGDQSLANKTVLLGFTLDRKTYLIMERFKSQSPFSRALLLIHESNIRKGSTVENAVRFDGLLFDALKAKAAHQPIDEWKLIRAGHAAKICEHMQDLLFGQLVREAGDDVRPTALFGPSAEGMFVNDDGEITVSYQQLLAARVVNSRAATDLYAGNFRVESEISTINRNDLISKFFSSLADEAASKGLQHATLSNTNFAIWVAKLPKQSRDLLAKCGRISDKTFFLTTKSGDDELPTVKLSGTCALNENTLGASWTPNLKGANLNQLIPLQCDVVPDGMLANCHP